MGEPIYFRSAPYLRRGAFYVLASAGPLALIACLVAQLVGANGLDPELFEIALLFLLMFAASIAILRLRYRIDDDVPESAPM